MELEQIRAMLNLPATIERVDNEPGRDVIEVERAIVDDTLALVDEGSRAAMKVLAPYNVHPPRLCKIAGTIDFRTKHEVVAVIELECKAGASDKVYLVGILQRTGPGASGSNSYKVKAYWGRRDESVGHKYRNADKTPWCNLENACATAKSLADDKIKRNYVLA